MSPTGGRKRQLNDDVTWSSRIPTGSRRSDAATVLDDVTLYVSPQAN